MSMSDSNDEKDDDMKKLTFKSLWVRFGPKRVQSIVWKMLKQRLPTNDNLLKRSIISANGDLLCALCGENNEDSTHLFFDCCFLTKLWDNLHSWTGVTMITHTNIFVHLLQYEIMMDPFPQGNIALTLWIRLVSKHALIWLIWKSRNEKIFLEHCTGREEAIGRTQGNNLIFDSGEKPESKI